MIDTSKTRDNSFKVSVFGCVSPVSQRLTACRVTSVSYTHLDVYKRQVYDVVKADISEKTKLALLNDFDQVLALNLTTAGQERLDAGTSVDAELEQFINEKIAERAGAKKAKDFARADAVSYTHRDVDKRQGNKGTIIDEVKKAIADGAKPEEIINDQLIAAINKVGEFFEQKKYFRCV